MQITRLKQRTIMFSYDTFSVCGHHSYVILGESFNYVLDTGCGSKQMQIVKDYLVSLKETKPIIVINSHYHWDHIWGNCAFKDSPIIATTKCQEMSHQYYQEMCQNNAKFIQGDVTETPPTLTFDTSACFKEDGLYLYASRGHTPDGLILYDTKERILHAFDNIGDTLNHPVPDLMDSKEEYLKALEFMEQFDFDILTSGHNDPQTKEFIKQIKTEV